MSDERDLYLFEYDITQNSHKINTRQYDDTVGNLIKAELAIRQYSSCAAKASNLGEMVSLNQQVTLLLSTCKKPNSTYFHQAQLIECILLKRINKDSDSLNLLLTLFPDTPADLSACHSRLLAEGYAIAGLLHKKEHRKLNYYINCMEYVSKAIFYYEELKAKRAKQTKVFTNRISLEKIFIPEIQDIPRLLCEEIIRAPSSSPNLYSCLTSLRNVIISSVSFLCRGVRLAATMTLAKLILFRFSNEQDNNSWALNYKASLNSGSRTDKDMISFTHLQPFFDPNSPNEEAILLLKIALEGIEMDTGFHLDKSGSMETLMEDCYHYLPDRCNMDIYDHCKESSQHSTAISLYWLLCISLVEQPESLTCVLQQSLRRQFFSPELIWIQYVESLMMCEEYSICYKALQTLISLRPKLVPARLIACKLTLDYLDTPNDCLTHAESLLLSDNKLIHAKALAIQGLATAKLARGTCEPHLRSDLIAQAISLMQQASSRDPMSSEYKYYYASLLAWNGDLSSASAMTKEALAIDPFDWRSSYLLTVILASQGQHGKALNLCERLKMEFPLENEVLLLIARLKFHHVSTSEALLVCKEAIGNWQLKHGNSLLVDIDISLESASTLFGQTSNVSSNIDRSTISSNSALGVEAGGYNDTRRYSMFSQNSNADTVPLSNYSSNQLDSLFNLWKMVGEIFTSDGKLTEALKSLKEASQLKPNKSPELLWCLAEVERLAGHSDKAKALYDSALSVAPSHTDTLESLAILLLSQDQIEQAEYYLRRVLDLKPTRPRSLQQMGLLCQKRGDFISAVKYFGKALACQQNQPLIPYESFLDKPLL